MKVSFRDITSFCISSRHATPHHTTSAWLISRAMLYWLPGIGTVGPKADPGTGTYLRYGGAVHGTVLWYMVRYVVRLWYVFTVRWCGTWYGIVVHGTVRGTAVVRIYGTVVRYMVRYCGTWYGTWYVLRYGGAVHGTVLWYMVRYVVRLWYVFTVRWCGTWYGIVVHGSVRATIVVRIFGPVVWLMVRYYGAWYDTWYGCGKFVLHGGVVRARYCGTVHGTKTPNGRYSHFRHLTSL